jgi:glycine/D-amino acid oxidase-like deaminating enzyme
MEPILADGWCAILLRTGYPIPPQAATHAFARLARERGARIVEGVAARPWVDRSRVRGVIGADGRRFSAPAVLVAAGPWSAPLVDPTGQWRPLAPTYGVTVQLAVRNGARHVLEEGLVHTVNRRLEAEAADAPVNPGSVSSLFSMVSVGEVTTIGSTFLSHAVDPGEVAPVLVERGSVIVPGLAAAPVLAARICARPQSVDGLPFIGPVDAVPGLYVCTGHGPWGISTGPGSARLASEAIAGEAGVPEALSAGRRLPG